MQRAWSPHPGGSPPGRSPAGKGPVRWGRVLAGVTVILLLAAPSLIGAVVASAGGVMHLRNKAVAEGRAPGELRFVAGAERYVVALSAKPDNIITGLRRRDRRSHFRVRSSDANEARCTITHPNGATSEVRGDRQGVSVTVGNVYATVGEFDGKSGPTTVTCRFDPPQDLLGTRTEAPLMVHALNSPLRYLTWGLFLALFVFAGIGTLLILWGTVWRGQRAD